MKLDFGARCDRVLCPCNRITCLYCIGDLREHDLPDVWVPVFSAAGAKLKQEGSSIRSSHEDWLRIHHLCNLVQLLTPGLKVDNGLPSSLLMAPSFRRLCRIALYRKKRLDSEVPLIKALLTEVAFHVELFGDEQ